MLAAACTHALGRLKKGVNFPEMVQCEWHLMVWQERGLAGSAAAALKRPMEAGLAHHMGHRLVFSLTCITEDHGSISMQTIVCSSSKGKTWGWCLYWPI